MGKIRVKTLGDEELEKEQKKKAQKRQEAKKEAKVSSEPNYSPVIPSAPSRSEKYPWGGVEGSLAAKSDETDSSVSLRSSRNDKTPKTEEKKTKKDKFAGKKKARNTRSKKYQTVAKLVDKNKIYKLIDALDILPNLHITKFDETVEIHVNTTETGVSGNLNLPHGTGKKVRVAIADDAIIAAIEKGKIDFDILLAEPSMMPKLAKVARVLGPRGLMPNPKNGTISTNPQEAAKKFEGGQTSFKTEAKMPIIHLSVGKLSFGKEKLTDNIKTAIKTIQTNKIKKAVLKSTMSPGIKIDFSTI